MGWFKRFRARHEERRSLYSSIGITHKAILKQLGNNHYRGYGNLNEEVRSLYRELIGQIGRFADIVRATRLVDTMFYGEEMKRQTRAVKHIDDEIINIMFSLEEQEIGKNLRVSQI